ncbi:hypothetical protein EGP64_03835 [bacterium]|nr:hypothetical protein [bacterium]
MESYIDINSVKNVSKKMIEYSSNLEDNLKQLESILENVESSWKSDDSRKFVSNIRENCIANFFKLNETVSKYEKYLSEIPDAYNILDEDFSQKIIDV